MAEAYCFGVDRGLSLRGAGDAVPCCSASCAVTVIYTLWGRFVSTHVPPQAQPVVV